MHTIKYARRTSPFSNSIRDTPVFVYAHEIRLRFKRICIVTRIDRHVATVLSFYSTISSFFLCLCSILFLPNPREILYLSIYDNVVIEFMYILV